jgi:hypothetical protein
MMGMGYVGIGDGPKQARGEGMGGVSVKMRQRQEDPDAKADVVDSIVTPRSEGHELTIHAFDPGHGSRQLQRITLAATEQTTGPERCGSQVHDANASVIRQSSGAASC